MTRATQRTICRWIHIVFGLPLIGYVYGPPAEVQQYAPMFQFVCMPILLLSGLWMWQGHVVSRLLSRAAHSPKGTA